MPPGFVLRPDACAKLGEASITLIRASAGYGKTALLGEWIAETGSADKAFVTLDQGDDDPRRFWAAVLSALRLPAGIDRADVLDSLARHAEPVYLVLDDLHEVRSEATRHEIAMLMRYRPSSLRLVLSTRTEPLLPLARLRLQEQVTELAAEELRLSVEQAAALLPGLSKQRQRYLVEVTDGWPAPLHLAARSPHIDIVDDPTVTDFLHTEVLAALSSDTVDVLTALSLCDEVTSALAVELTGRDDAGRLLNAVGDLMVSTQPDRSWFRMHPLLRAHLRATMRQDARTALHEKAAAWFTSQNLPDRAFEHLAHSGERPATESLLRTDAARTLLNGDGHGAIRHALVAVGPDAVRRSPPLALISALANVQFGDDRKAEEDFAACRAAWPDAPEDDLLRLRELVLTTRSLAGLRPPPAETIDWREIIAAYEGSDLESWARLAYGWTLIHRDHRLSARVQVEAAAKLAARSQLLYVRAHCLWALATVSWLDGEFAVMSSTARQAIEASQSHEWSSPGWMRAGRLMIGLAELQAMAPVAARRHAELATDGPDTLLLGYATAALTGAALVDLGQRQTGLEILHEARHVYDTRRLPRPLLVAGALVEHQCTLTLGHVTATQQLMSWLKDRVGPVPELALMRAQAAFARGDLASADEALGRVLSGSSPPLCATTPVEARLSETALELHRGRRTHAREALDTAMELAEPAGLVRPFHHAAAPVRKLLQEQVGSFGPANSFAAHVSHVVSAVNGNADTVLTSREHAVLVRLSSLQPLDELATDMQVSVNTVKTHVRSIYAKLGVNNRRSAVVASRQLGIG